MNREIKFRAWHPDSGMAFFDLDSVFQEFGDEPTYGCVLFDDGDLRHIKDVELMQYTGLKDKNGKEIYEGDIILLDPKRHHVYKDVVIFAAVFWDQVQGSYYHTYTDGRPPKRMFEGCEVIGNIYENPELLEGK